jgi:hypothetical protein
MGNPFGNSNYVYQLTLRKDERAVGADEPVLGADFLDVRTMLI